VQPSQPVTPKRVRLIFSEGAVLFEKEAFGKDDFKMERNNIKRKYFITTSQTINNTTQTICKQ
jgi:hypothetical protein